jgi:hypothetical protein
MTSVNITTDINTVTVLDDGATIIVTTGSVSKDTFDALEARVAALEARVKYSSQPVPYHDRGHRGYCWSIHQRGGDGLYGIFTAQRPSA